MLERRVVTLIVSVFLLAVFAQPFSAQAQKNAAQSDTGDLFEPVIKRATAALELTPDQATQLRAVLEQHRAKLTDLRNHLRSQPYLPKLQSDLEDEDKIIKDQMAAFLNESQKAKLASFDVRALPPPPGFILIGLPARDQGDPIPAEASMPPPQAKGKTQRLTDDQRVLQLLNRITYGPRPGDVQAVKNLGIDAYLDQQLHSDRIDDSALESRLEVLPTLHFTSSELYQYYPDPNAALKRAADKNAPPVYGRPRQITVELMQQKLVRAVESKRQLQEVMTDFWFNHFNVFIEKQPGPYLLTSFENDVIRPNALGKFRDLLLAVANSPAMLFYLDNWLSQASGAVRPRQPSAQPAPPKPKSTPRVAVMTAQTGAVKADVAQRPAAGDSDKPRGAANTTAQASPPSESAKAPKPAPPKPGVNENYARELMELHTLGVQGGYTQTDVQEVARCFTGWTLDNGYQGNATFVFRPWMHDSRAKKVLGVDIPAGGGYGDGLQVLDILARHPSTAAFISHELCERFVSDSPPDQLVERVARVFQRTDGDIAEVLRAIFTSPEFNSPAAFRSKIKSPLELAASALRALDGETDGGPPIEGWITRAGEALYRYQFPTGYGEDSSRWVNSGVFLNRLNFMVELANNRIKGTHYDPARFVAGDPKSARQDSVAMERNSGVLLDRLSALIIHTNLSAESRRVLMASMGEAANPRVQARPASATDSRAHPAPASYDQSEAGRVSQVIELLLGTAEFQRR